VNDFSKIFKCPQELFEFGLFQNIRHNKILEMLLEMLASIEFILEKEKHMWSYKMKILLKF
jgi:hypothetical protein